MKISEIKDKELRELAELRRDESVREYSNLLDAAFLWGKTPEGAAFWSDVWAGKITELSKDKKQKTLAEQWNVKEFPFKLYDKNGNVIYIEYSNKSWHRYEKNDKGQTTFYEGSNGYSYVKEYDEQGKEIYFKDSNGVIIDNRPKHTIEETEKETVIRVPKGVEFEFKTK